MKETYNIGDIVSLVNNTKAEILRIDYVRGRSLLRLISNSDLIHETDDNSVVYASIEFISHRVESNKNYN